ncbi:hypothetical protein V7S43_013882 [Phytophthora oleae]|uniref:Uncharacterized protein n=1 Tax=Phytophthora oleae TaxID=2107226 RepID=A0ABD3F4S6_9STRA
MSIVLAFFASPMGSTLLSIMVLLFGKFISSELNDGHMEYLHFTLAGIMIVTIFLFVKVTNKMQLG